MHKIIIIEDIREEYDNIVNILGVHTYNFELREVQKFNILKSNIDKYYTDHISQRKKEDAAHSIISILGQHTDVRLFIIDYQLKEGSALCNGLNFYRDFVLSKEIIKNTPALFLTKTESRKDINKIKMYIDKSDNKDALDFLLKENSNDDSYGTNLKEVVSELINRKQIKDAEV